MTPLHLRQEERRWRRGDLLAILCALAIGGAIAWIVLMVQSLNGDLRDANEARDALARQVEQLGEKPIAGPPGSRGDPDDAKPGPRGPRGPAGERGDRGPTGKPGNSGKDGDAGSDGKTGKAGVDGAKGEKGEPGQEGVQGEPGPEGPKGEPGEAGPRGEQGPQGERGPAGPAPSSWTWTYNGVTYTCTPTSDGSTSYNCTSSGGEPEPSDTKPQAAALDPSRRTYP